MKKLFLYFLLMSGSGSIAMYTGGFIADNGHLEAQSHDQAHIRSVINQLIPKLRTINQLMQCPLFLELHDDMQDGLNALVLYVILRCRSNAAKLFDPALSSELFEIQQLFFSPLSLRFFWPTYVRLRDSGFLYWFKRSIEDKSIYSEIALLSL